MDQLEGEREEEEEKQREEWEASQPGGQPPSSSFRLTFVSLEKTPTCQSLSKVAAVVSKGNTVQITRQILFCSVTCRLASSSASNKNISFYPGSAKLLAPAQHPEFPDRSCC